MSSPLSPPEPKKRVTISAILSYLDSLQDDLVIINSRLDDIQALLRTVNHSVDVDKIREAFARQVAAERVEMSLHSV